MPYDIFEPARQEVGSNDCAWYVLIFLLVFGLSHANPRHVSIKPLWSVDDKTEESGQLVRRNMIVGLSQDMMELHVDYQARPFDPTTPVRLVMTRPSRSFPFEATNEDGK